MSTAAQRMATAPIRFYQRFISPLTPPTCRFYPTCSQYALEAIRTHGVFKGMALASWRLLKCGPWHRGGVDHVPPRRTPRTDETTSDHGES